VSLTQEFLAEMIGVRRMSVTAIFKRPEPSPKRAVSTRSSIATPWSTYLAGAIAKGPTNKKRPLNGAAHSLDKRTLLGGLSLEAGLFDGVGHLGDGHQRTRDLVEQLVGIFLFRQ
jgi:hypothetical protein